MSRKNECIRLTRRYLRKQMNHLLNFFKRGYEDGEAGKDPFKKSDIPHEESELARAIGMTGYELYLRGYSAGVGSDGSERI